MTGPSRSRVAGRHGAGGDGADVDARFADLVSADTQLLRAEFDAIIAANFPRTAGRTRRRPPARPVPSIAERQGREVPPRRGRPSSCGRKPEPARSAVDDRARPRSPPRRPTRVDPSCRPQRDDPADAQVHAPGVPTPGPRRAG